MSPHDPHFTPPQAFIPGQPYPVQNKGPLFIPLRKLLMLLTLVIFLAGFAVVLILLVKTFTQNSGFDLDGSFSNLTPTIFTSPGVAVEAVAFSPDGKSLAGAYSNGTVKLWEVNSGKELLTFQGHKGGVYSIAFSPDGKSLAGGGENGIELWEVSSGKELASFPGPSTDKHINAIAFSPDGRSLAGGGNDGNIILWEVSSGKKEATFEDHRKVPYGSSYEDRANEVFSVAFSPDGKILASGNDHGSIKLWKVGRGKLGNILNHWSGEAFNDEHNVYSVAFSPDGSTIVGGIASYTNNNLQFWDVSSGKEVASFFGGRVYSVAFSRDGKTVGIGGGNITGLWDVSTRKEVGYSQEPYGWGPREHQVQIDSIAFGQDERIFATGSSDGTIKLWKPKNLK